MTEISKGEQRNEKCEESQVQEFWIIKVQLLLESSESKVLTPCQKNHQGGDDVILI